VDEEEIAAMSRSNAEASVEAEEASMGTQPPITLIDTLIEKVRALPVEKQRVALDFVESLIDEGLPQGTGRSLSGAWADLAVDITEEEFQEARREIWANFPRPIER
jgi:hypothetical protein